MGVTILYPYSLSDGKTGQQAIEYLTKRVLALGAIPAGQFIVDCETYFSAPHHGPSKVVHVLHNSEHPASTFALLDSGTKQISLVADNLFDWVMVKMSPVYASKKQNKSESKGARYEYGDFLIKIGSVTMGDNFKGILIEVEYRPCMIPASCWEILRELLQGLLGQPVMSAIPAFFAQPSPHAHPGQNHSKQNDVYQPIDTICQYLDHFVNYRKQTVMGMQQQMGVPPGIRQ